MRFFIEFVPLLIVDLDVIRVLELVPMRLLQVSSEFTGTQNIALHTDKTKMIDSDIYICIIDDSRL